MPCRATQDGRVMVERSDRMWSTGEGNGKPFQYSCLENPMNSRKSQNNRILNEELLTPCPHTVLEEKRVFENGKCPDWDVKLT